jgi:hypothetical protein
MSQRVPLLEETEGRSAREQFLHFLNEALNIADSNLFPPEIGARIQEVIDLTEGLVSPGDRVD